MNLARVGHPRISLYAISKSTTSKRIFFCGGIVDTIVLRALGTFLSRTLLSRRWWGFWGVHYTIGEVLILPWDILDLESNEFAFSFLTSARYSVMVLSKV